MLVSTYCWLIIENVSENKLNSWGGHFLKIGKYVLMVSKNLKQLQNKIQSYLFNMILLEEEKRSHIIKVSQIQYYDKLDLFVIYTSCKHTLDIWQHI